MKQLLTQAIVLRRTNYGEADRILTLLTPDYGKLRLMARGVRKVKSKLAGGIELFSVSDITFITGKGDIGTLISTRLVRHYGQVVKTLDRVQLGYDLIKRLDRATEDHPEAAYYELLEQAFAALDDSAIDTELIRLWFMAQLLRLGGHTPNLRRDTAGQPLDAGQRYNFDVEAMTFAPHPKGNFAAAQIQAQRLLFSDHRPAQLTRVKDLPGQLPQLRQLTELMLNLHIRI